MEKGKFGFTPTSNGRERQYAPIVLEREPRILTAKDLGLVLTASGAPFKGHQHSARIVVTEDGLPIQDPDQMQAYEQRVNIALSQGRLQEEVIRPFPYVVEPLKYIDEYGEVAVNTYAFPRTILKWSQGLFSTTELVHPACAVPELDLKRKRYTPNRESLLEHGYTEEGVRRLTNLGLMTHIVSFANGFWRVQVYPDQCRIQVLLTDEVVTKYDLKSPDGDIPFGVGIHLVAGLAPFRHDGSFIPGYDQLDALPQFTAAARELITSELNQRTAVIEATRKAMSSF